MQVQKPKYVACTETTKKEFKYQLLIFLITFVQKCCKKNYQDQLWMHFTLKNMGMFTYEEKIYLEINSMSIKTKGKCGNPLSKAWTNGDVLG